MVSEVLKVFPRNIQSILLFTESSSKTPRFFEHNELSQCANNDLSLQL